MHRSFEKDPSAAPMLVTLLGVLLIIAVGLLLWNAPNFWKPEKNPKPPSIIPHGATLDESMSNQKLLLQLIIQDIDEKGPGWI